MWSKQSWEWETHRNTNKSVLLSQYVILLRLFNSSEFFSPLSLCAWREFLFIYGVKLALCEQNLRELNYRSTLESNMELFMRGFPCKWCLYQFTDDNHTPLLAWTSLQRRILCNLLLSFCLFVLFICFFCFTFSTLRFNIQSLFISEH